MAPSGRALGDDADATVDQEISPQQLEFFESKIRPVLAEHCYSCHSAAAAADGKLKGGLQLDTREGTLLGGDSGPAVEPGEVDYSLLIEAVRYDSYEMPPAGKLPDEVVADLERWVEMGAPDPRGEAVAEVVGGVDLEAGRRFWSFQPLARQEPPEVEGADWVRTPIDHFVLAKQEAAGLQPNGRADLRKLVRRVYFDLTGLPPAPEQVEQFLQAANADFDAAWAALVDQLLESDHYGERWARHWMDVARFAESHGYEQDYDRPHAYHYRDFLIKALNADMPYDQFVRWQIAGDELAPDEPLALMATGFLGAGAFPTQLTEAEFESSRYDELDDMVATTGVAVLGLSIGCARCHDHKFDPIPASDYYSLAATFATAIRSEIELDLAPEENAEKLKQYERRRSALAEELATYEQEVLPQAFHDWLQSDASRALQAVEEEAGPSQGVVAAADRLAESPDDAEAREEVLAWYRTTQPEWTQRSEALAACEEEGPALDLTKVMVCSEGWPHLSHHADGRGFPHFYPEVHHLVRGDVHQKGEVANQGFLQVLMRGDRAAEDWRTSPPEDWTRTSYRRTALADWLTDVDAGAGALAARVAVNRLWQHHFGRGIVATPSDFGASGERPSHPELLDWLAGRLVDEGWSLKAMHRLIANSSVYLQSAAFDESRAEIDRENVLLWRRAPRRLEAEPIRDAMLALSGKLDRTMYGPGSLDAKMNRRSVYFFIKRSKLIPQMMLFDWPEHLVSIGDRSSTTIAPQALLFLNGPQTRRHAEGFADRLTGLAAEEFVDQAYRLAYARSPTREESELATAFLRLQAARHEEAGATSPKQTARADLCQAMFAANEFVYVE